jgi:4-oxalocrotonate tautomerase
MDEDFRAVAAVMADYFDGLYHSDTKRLERVFHPMAQYVCATDGTLLHRTMAEYFPVVDARPSPASRNEPRRDRILSIDFHGPVTARALVTCAIAEKDFIDCLTLVKLDGRWQVISKVFHFDVRKD